MKVRSRSTLVANMNLENVKNKGRDGTPKKFTFRLEGLPAFCIVSHILGISVGQDAFRDSFTNIQQLYGLVIPVAPGRVNATTPGQSWYSKAALEGPFTDTLMLLDASRIRWKFVTSSLDLMISGRQGGFVGFLVTGFSHHGRRKTNCVLISRFCKDLHDT
ncbi:hypothetical protein GQ44DRAFT_148067 [Phaeosphaeriaceae sp. PMI808]|nr:hypothetical protein GQ44DRAFT_148067 [Phaeosphaeriaceae sp. PMI808]